jgi:GNAT superfamily N-acetyltransferase
MRVTVRLAEPQDVLPAAQARVASWRVAYSGLIPQARLDELDPAADAVRYQGYAEQGLLMVALLDDRVVGMSLAGAERDPAPPGTGEVMAFYLDPAVWRQGIGTALIVGTRDHLVAQGFHRVWLWVLERNGPARAFYEQVGFALTGDRKLDRNGLVDLRYAWASSE